MKRCLFLLIIAAGGLLLTGCDKSIREVRAPMPERVLVPT